MNMPTATRQPLHLPRQRRAAGFTLIEILIVVVIIAVMSSLVVVAVGDNNADRLQEEADRFAALSRLASEEAVVSGNWVGLKLDTRSYAWLVPSMNEWVPMEDDNLFRLRELGEDFVLEIYIEGDAPDTGLSGDEEEDDDAELPQTVYYPSGEVIPYEIVLRHEDVERYYTVTTDITGQVKVESHD